MGEGEGGGGWGEIKEIYFLRSFFWPMFGIPLLLHTFSFVISDKEPIILLLSTTLIHFTKHFILTHTKAKIAPYARTRIESDSLASYASVRRALWEKIWRTKQLRASEF